jgi:hypothetical protein
MRRRAEEEGVVWVADKVYMNVGQCRLNDMLISHTVQWYFHKFYTSIYVICFVLVIVFYSLICSTVLARQKRRRNKKISLRSETTLQQPIRGFASQHVIDTTKQQTTLLPQLNHISSATSLCESVMDRQDDSTKVRVKVVADAVIVKKGHRRLRAEIKAAGMLFVVSMVLLVTYIPALLITLDWLPYSAPVFYLYFINFAINPVIYGFMNSRFRKRLKSIFSCQRTNVWLSNTQHEMVIR